MLCFAFDNPIQIIHLYSVNKLFYAMISGSTVIQRITFDKFITTRPIPLDISNSHIAISFDSEKAKVTKVGVEAYRVFSSPGDAERCMYMDCFLRCEDNPSDPRRIGKPFDKSRIWPGSWRHAVPYHPWKRPRSLAEGMRIQCHRTYFSQASRWKNGLPRVGGWADDHFFLDVPRGQTLGRVVEMVVHGGHQGTGFMEPWRVEQCDLMPWEADRFYEVSGRRELAEEAKGAWLGP
jgi:hypothetical protein